jgi:hypothetical protein
MPGNVDPNLYELVLDLESQGLRTKRFDRFLGYEQRKLTESLLISQFAFAKSSGEQLLNKEGNVIGEGFTDIINETLLAKHGMHVPKGGMGKKEATQMAKNLPQTFLDDLTTRRELGYWDPDIKIKGSVLRGVLERHVETVLTGAKVRNQKEYIGEIFDHIIQQLDRGQNVKVAGWNVGFDWDLLTEGALHDTSLMSKLTRIQNHRAFQVVDAAAPIREIAFQEMLHDPTFGLKFTDYAKLEKVAREANPDLKAFQQDHRALRTFMDDLREFHKTQKSKVFEDRVMLAEKHPMFTPEKGKYIVDELSQVKDYKSFNKMTQRVRGNRNLTGLNQLIREMYLPNPKDPNAYQHINILGKVGRTADLRSDGFSMILGWRQESIARALRQVDGQNSKISRLMDMGLHDAQVDRQLTAHIHDRLRDILREGRGSAGWRTIKEHLQNPKHSAARVLSELRIALDGPRGGAAGGIETSGAAWWKRVNEYIGKKGTKFWGKTALVGAGLYLLGKWNKDDSQIEGIRSAESMWDNFQAIDPTYGGSDFGSGRDVLAQLTGVNYAPWVQATALGLRGENLYRALQDLPYHMGNRNATKPSMWQENMELGRHRGQLAEMMFADHLIATEYPVEDPYYKIKGRIDLVLEGNIPLEVKTVADALELSKLKGPKGPAASQANYYAHALGAPYSLVAYFARDDPGQWKLFTVPKDEMRLLDDLAAARQAQAQIALQGPEIRLDRELWDRFSTAMKRIQYSVWDPVTYNPPAGGMAPGPRWEGMNVAGDFSKYHRAVFRRGYAGRVQHMHETALKSKVEDKRARNQCVQTTLGRNRVPSRPYAAGSRRES